MLYVMSLIVQYSEKSIIVALHEMLKMWKSPPLLNNAEAVPKTLTLQSSLMAFQKIPKCQRAQQSQRCMDKLIMGAAN